MHDSMLNRGVMDRSHPVIKVPLKLDDSYDSVLTSCVSSLWPDTDSSNGSSGFEFYLADSSGGKIEPKLKWEGKEIQWTLDIYIKISGARFPSRFHLYCVRMQIATAGMM